MCHDLTAWYQFFKLQNILYPLFIGLVTSTPIALPQVQDHQ